jgi:hypothetical protein
MFGGASRDEDHFDDLWCLDYNSSNTTNNSTTHPTTASNWVQLTTTGDIPTPRTGHAMAVYLNYIFLFGGQHYVDEESFDDIYILSLGKVSQRLVSSLYLTHHYQLSIIYVV